MLLLLLLLCSLTKPCGRRASLSEGTGLLGPSRAPKQARPSALSRLCKGLRLLVEQPASRTIRQMSERPGLWFDLDREEEWDGVPLTWLSSAQGDACVRPVLSRGLRDKRPVVQRDLFRHLTVRFRLCFYFVGRIPTSRGSH